MKYQTRKLILKTSKERDTVKTLADNAPDGIEVIFREYVKPRINEQNAAMWSGSLKDIAEQAWVDGRLYEKKVWHEYFKRKYLPEEYIEGETMEGYRKWDITPSGERVLIGSTTQLTTKGFGTYMEKIYAHGGSLGVLFHTIER